MNLILNSSYVGAIKVLPRWPYREVHVSVEVLKNLEFAQTQLNSDVRLVLTRGFEPGNLLTRSLYALLRQIGGLIFTVIFRHRISERSEIFSSNGHDIDGTHVDISIEQNGHLRKFLPFGVFSTCSSVARAKEANAALLHKVHGALIQSGFMVHSNPTESLQIHCDFNKNGTSAAEQIGAHDSRLVVENM